MTAAPFREIEDFETMHLNAEGWALRAPAELAEKSLAVESHVEQVFRLARLN